MWSLRVLLLQRKCGDFSVLYKQTNNFSNKMETQICSPFIKLTVPHLLQFGVR